MWTEPPSRRRFLTHAAGGAGALALALLEADARRAAGDVFAPAAAIDPVHPLRERKPHFTPRAKRVIFLFQYGGPSQVDTWDYKPELEKLAGKPVPESLKAVQDQVGGVFNHCKDSLLSFPWKWSRHGDSGLWASELLPHMAAHADRLCLIRSMTADSSNHAPATYQMNTGAILAGKPSFGSWLTYGLGSENQNLPGYVLLFDVAGLGGPPNWASSFLPAAFQGTRFRYEGEPVFNLRPPAELADVQRPTLDLAQEFNRLHRERRPGLLDLDGRIASYELAYRMQAEALAAGDLSGETAETLELYGVNDANEQAAKYARMCLLARRLSERGVRIVQTYHSFNNLGWDAHDTCNEYCRRNAAQTDRAIGALLTDLQRRGLWDETLVIWAGEFGRTPMEQGNGGRNHSPYGFTLWLAGGGVKGGQAIGSTDEIGLRAVEAVQRPKDLHATLLHLLGLRCEELFFEHLGRPERLTGVAGSARVIEEVCS